MRGARGAEPGQPRVVAELHPRRGLHRGLDDHGGELRRVLGDQVHRDVETRGIVERGCPDDREAQGLEHVGTETVVADRQRADRVAVVCPAEGQERRSPGRGAIVPVLERDLQRLFHGGGAVAGIEEMRVVDGHDARQCLGQLDDDAIAVAEHRRVGAECELSRHGVVQLGHVVSERRDPERRDGVEIAPSVDVDQLVTLGAVDDDRAAVGERRHLRKSVPDNLRIALHPLVVRGHPPILAQNVEMGPTRPWPRCCA